MKEAGVSYVYNAFLWGLRSFWGSKYAFVIISEGWSSDSYEGAFNFELTCHTPILVQDGPRPQKKTIIIIYISVIS